MAKAHTIFDQNYAEELNEWLRSSCQLQNVAHNVVFILYIIYLQYFGNSVDFVKLWTTCILQHHMIGKSGIVHSRLPIYAKCSLTICLMHTQIGTNVHKSYKV